MLFHPSAGSRPRPMPASWVSSRARIIPGTITASRRSGASLKGVFTIDGRLCPQGTMLYHPDPHFEGAFHTENGGEILTVWYPGRSNGERPISSLQEEGLQGAGSARG
jgi:hypothetical protein